MPTENYKGYDLNVTGEASWGGQENTNFKHLIDAKQDISQKGVQNGYAPLEADGKIGNQYLPSIVGVQGAVGTNGLNGFQGSQGFQGSGYSATSVTSLTIAITSQTFITQVGLAYLSGSRIRVASSSLPLTNWMDGVVTAYDVNTGIMTVNIDTVSGAGVGQGQGTAGILRQQYAPGNDGSAGLCR